MAPIFSRQQNSSTTNNQIASGLIVGIFVFVVLLCVLCLYHLKRVASKKQSATPFGVKGGVRPMAMEAPPRHRASIPAFSRERLTASIILPEKTISPKLYACETSDSSSNLPTPSPASSTSSLRRPPPPNAPSPRSRALSILNPAHPRHSRSSSGFSGYSQHRFPPGLSPRPSLASLVSPSQARPVYQSFEPTLPDELLLRGGEQLSVLQSFDDGWCVVARDTARSSRSFLSSGTKNNGENVDIGLVPVWVFSKPRESVASTRPFRSASLNALRQNLAAREMLTSWSNFA